MASVKWEALGHGVTRSKRRVMQWLRTAAENGHADACSQLASSMYEDTPYARVVGHVEEATRVATPIGVMEGHDIPPDVMAGVVHWFSKGGYHAVDELGVCRREALEGSKFCFNEGCEVLGQLKEFKVCPQCKTARYCSAACQKGDWNAGGHKDKCGTTAAHGKYSEYDLY